MEKQNSLIAKDKLTCILFIFYLIMRFLFTSHLDALGPYATYIFELIIAIVVLGIHREKIKQFFTLNQRLILISGFTLVFGYFVFKSANFLQINVPFVLKDIETIFFLLIVAPILEELIFRFFAWVSFAKVNGKIVLLCTSLIFSYSHFHAYWFVPSDVHGFIIYQSLYTFILSLICGYSILKYNSLLGAMLIHFAFNLGFYIGYIV